MSDELANYSDEKRKEMSEEMLHDLLIDLREKTWKWAKLTKQTPQAKMGYIGQHIVSIVTGYEGGRTGARGDDLVIPDEDTGEIKTCYRIDQLGKCKDCKASVSSWEEKCPNEECNSTNIDRKDDSKWLFSPKSVEELEKLFAIKWIYCVLLEFEDINDGDSPIVVSIFQIDPSGKGFSNMIIDYYFNNKEAKEKNGKRPSPFNFWPDSPKFYLCKPERIYHAKISGNKINTMIFPGLNDAKMFEIPSVAKWSRKKILDSGQLQDIMQRASLSCSCKKQADECWVCFQKWREEKNIPNEVLADILIKYAYYEKNSDHDQHLPY